jgi:uncharacterized protein
MKTSLYNILVTTPGERDLLLNSFTRAVVPIAKADSAEIASGLIVSESVRRALEEVGGLVDDPTEQQSVVFDAFDAVKNRKDQLTVVIPLTSRCNLACGYCYQVIHGDFQGDGAPPPSRFEWQPQTIDALRKFCRRQLEDEGYKSIRIRWYGGEPLLRIKQLATIGQQIKADAEELGKGYSGMVVTNGTVLTERVIRELQALNVDRLEISLDGPPKTHNIQRPGKLGAPTYSAVLAAILAASEVFHTIILRVNVHSRNINELSPWFDKIGPLVANRRIFLKLKLVEGDLTNTLSWTDFCEAIPAILRNAKANGIRLIQTSLVTELCPAIRRDYFIVQSDLRVYKCPQNLGSEHHVASIDQLGQLNETWRMNKWMDYSVRSNAECSSCAHSPHCNGGCPYNEIMAGIDSEALSKYSRKEHCCVEKIAPDALIPRIL